MEQTTTSLHFYKTCFTEGRELASSYDAKFIETSAGLKHNVDKLLVGVLKQILLREEMTVDQSRPKAKIKVEREDADIPDILNISFSLKPLKISGAEKKYLFVNSLNKNYTRKLEAENYVGVQGAGSSCSSLATLRLARDALVRLCPGTASRNNSVSLSCENLHVL